MIAQEKRVSGAGQVYGMRLMVDFDVTDRFRTTFNRHPDHRAFDRV